MEFDSDKPVDFLKFAVALVTMAVSESTLISATNPVLAAETTRARLLHLHAELVAAADRFSGTPLGRYTDGRAVVSTLDFDESHRIFAHAWHPDFNHSMNAPGEAGVIETENGARRRVIVSAPGHLDWLALAETAEGADDLGHRAMIWPEKQSPPGCWRGADHLTASRRAGASGGWGGFGDVLGRLCGALGASVWRLTGRWV